MCPLHVRGRTRCNLYCHVALRVYLTTHYITFCITPLFPIHNIHPNPILVYIRFRFCLFPQESCLLYFLGIQTKPKLLETFFRGTRENYLFPFTACRVSIASCFSREQCM
ncbi:hypothetical protein ES332_D13G189300v1 [Gossypium tomentosum]|uniref:Uncharacterized protein n=1 Tax=Gossypium tomentosum TaxID=34277 RepID=A0A5D2HYJ3_GOSTO|nr:hypothetical protein ES332_D13G189300v1 [Gossypium tomentosum]